MKLEVYIPLLIVLIGHPKLQIILDIHDGDVNSNVAMTGAFNNAWGQTPTTLFETNIRWEKKIVKIKWHDLLLARDNMTQILKFEEMEECFHFGFWKVQFLLQRCDVSEQQKCKTFNELSCHFDVIHTILYLCCNVNYHKFPVVTSITVSTSCLYIMARGSVVSSSK